MNESEDRLLFETIISGDPQAFVVFIRNYERLVGHIVGRMVRNKADRQDLGQDIFIKIYQNLSQFQFKCKISTWVARIAFNTCVNYLQKKRIPLLADLDGSEDQDPFAGMPSPTPDSDQWAESREITQQVQQAIQGLAPMYSLVLTLYHVEEKKYQEIAEIMELPEGTVKSYLFRARKMVKERLAGFYLVEAL
jgi:RNA polymerase sigma factor (sigma-70 family)